MVTVISTVHERSINSTDLNWQIFPNLSTFFQRETFRRYKPHMGAYLGKGTYWQFFHKLDSRETSLLNAANHLKIFLIEFEICLCEHLYFLYLRNPLSQLLPLFPCFGNLKLTCLIKKIVFQLYKTSQSAITFDRGACSTHCLQY